MNAMNRIVSSVILTVAVLMPSFASSAALPEFREIVRENSPAVVKIVVQHSAAARDQGQPGAQEMPEYLRRFFEFRGQPPIPREQMATGSGFIISDDGYIVTNNHVVDGADSVLVRLSDRREFDAEVVGTDPRSDLALLRVDAKGLPSLKLARGDDLEVGEWVLAIGSPFGLDYSVTAGIVSAKGRSLPTENNENYVPFIQTDVAINPGNSGGPLFNLEGDVVGVNSQILSRSGGSIGLSFAIPVSVVSNVVEQLKDQGRVTRGWLGVTIQDVDKNLAESFGLSRTREALVVQVAPDGPADKAGLQAGDVITTFDGDDIPASSDLPHVVGLVAPGTTVPVEVFRDKKRKTLKVKVGGLDADDSFSLSSGQGSGGQGGRLGMVVETADAEVLERFGINGGVVVREVLPGSAASDAGVIPGDIITICVIGDKPLTKSAQAYEDTVAELSGGSSVPLRLIRRGSPLFIGLKLKD